LRHGLFFRDDRTKGPETWTIVNNSTQTLHFTFAALNLAPFALTNVLESGVGPGEHEYSKFQMVQKKDSVKYRLDKLTIPVLAYLFFAAALCKKDLESTVASTATLVPLNVFG
jgi:hypothetical protein